MAQHLAIELLAELVRSESISGNELGNVAIYARFAEAAGFVPVVDGRNVWLTLGSGDGPALLLNSHLDTVKAGETWKRDPWDGAIEGDRLHGLGANDAKGSVAAQFAAAVALKEAGFAGNLVVCASCDEETGGEGMERIAHLLPRYDAAIIGEPNDMLVAAAQRGLVKAAIKVPGRRAHASRPWQGHNAVHAAARAAVCASTAASMPRATASAARGGFTQKRKPARPTATCASSRWRSSFWSSCCHYR
jgi:acetylornithine deacetylase